MNKCQQWVTSFAYPTCSQYKYRYNTWTWLPITRITSVLYPNTNIEKILQREVKDGVLVVQFFSIPLISQIQRQQAYCKAQPTLIKFTQDKAYSATGRSRLNLQYAWLNKAKQRTKESVSSSAPVACSHIGGKTVFDLIVHASWIAQGSQRLWGDAWCSVRSAAPSLSK